MTTFWGCRIVPFLALLFLVALCHSTSVHDYKCYSFSRRGKGAIIPYGDIVIEVGSSYKAFCLFNPDEVAVEEVYFEKEGKRIEDYTVVNSSAISVEVSHSEATEYKLQCLKGRNDFMCERSVYVGYKPQDVENFKCISMNWEKLNCSWSIPENPVKVTYTFTYVVPGFLLDSRECPQQGIRSNWCSWEGVDFISGRKDWVMTFTAKNSLQSEPVEFKHYINLFETVIPKMADKFEVHVLGPREVNLTWTLPHPIDVFSEGNVTHQVKYRNLLTNGSWKLFDQWEERPFRFSRKTFTRVIGALQPYVEYEFCVRLHTGTGEIRENMWSTPALVIKRTFAAQPAVTPLTTMGMFEVEEAKFHRDVYVNWQTVDPLFENGPNFGYDVRIFATTYGSPVSSPVFTKRSFHKFMKLEKHETYRFEIRPKNSIGLPEDLDVKSVMMLPKEAALLSTPRYFKVIAYPDANTTTYMVRWRLPHVHHQDRNIETVTLYWCRQTEYENRCQNKIGWEIVDEPNMNVKNLTGYDIYSRYMFGISVNSKNSSSGIKWSGCIARHGEQQPTLKKFNYTHIFSTEVKLKWELDCKAEAAQPNAFNISYCGLEENEKGCSDSEMYVRVDGESTVEYTVRNLHPYKNYSFNIASISDLGLGKWSPNVYVMTKPDKPSGPPQNMRAIDSGQTWSLLSWEPPLKSEQNGEIIKYIIREKIRDPLSLRVLGHTQQGNNLTFNATHLEPFTEYHFEVIACTNVNEQPSCGTAAAYVNVTTKIGAPGKIDSLFYDSDWLKWDFDECNGPSCFFLLNYTVNGTEYNTTTRAGQHAVSLEDLNASCSSKQGDIEVSLHALSRDEEGHQLSGPRKDMKISCSSKVLALWIILTIAVMCIIMTLVIVGIFTCGWEQVKQFKFELTRQLALPVGLDSHMSSAGDGKKYFYQKQITRNSIATSNGKVKDSEEQDLIKPGGERQHRNFSGDSGTSVADPADSSGCSTGGDSVSSSGSDRIPQSSDSGTVQEEAGFPTEDKEWSASVRLRTPAPAYVRQSLPEKMPSMRGYVSVGSVPNLPVASTDGISPLQQSNPSLGLGTLPEVPMGGRRTSTGYISMPTNEFDGFPLEDLRKLVLPHEHQQGDYLPYSRHYNMPYKKISDFSPNPKAQSLPWLNTGYVAVAQVEDSGGRIVPGAQGYVAVGDTVGMMKRQPSLPSLPMDMSKTLTTTDEAFPPGAYCKLGARGSPDPPTSSLGYVSATQHMPTSSTPAVSSPPVFKSPYVTCAMVDSMVSPKKEPKKATADYVSVGDMASGQWAHPIIHPITAEETREVSSAPVEGSRGRIIPPVRPNSSETNHTRGSSQFAPSGHSLSKQSSGYASGNVSQETLTFHDPVVMSPKKLLARSHEPHSIVCSPNHKASMV